MNHDKKVRTLDGWWNADISIGDKDDAHGVAYSTLGLDIRMDIL